MRLLRKTWFRIFISLIGGGITAEIIHASTGDPVRPMEFNPSLVVAAILFIVLTFGIYLYNHYILK